MKELTKEQTRILEACWRADGQGITIAPRAWGLTQKPTGEAGQGSAFTWHADPARPICPLAAVQRGSPVVTGCEALDAALLLGVQNELVSGFVTAVD